jgi:hypothetical protein
MHKEDHWAGLITVNDQGEFMIGETRLIEVTAGQIGAVLDLIPYSPRNDEEPYIVRVYQETPFECGEQARQVISLKEMNFKDSREITINPLTWVDHAREHYMVFNKELTEQRFGDAATRSADHKRLDELTKKRNELSAELQAVTTEEETLKKKYGL